MKKLLKQTTNENFKYDNDINQVIRVSYSYSESYSYDSEQERTTHIAEMDNYHWIASCITKENLGTINEPDYKWFAMFTKTKY